MRDETAPLVSVVVPTYNSAHRLDRLLRALTEQTVSEPYETILVDDASTDGTAKQLAEWPTVQYVRAERRGGSYVARNLGLAAASGDVIAFTDADCTPTSNWLERGLAELRSGADLVAGRIDTALPARPSIPALVDSIRFLDQELYATTLGFGATANLFVRRPIFDRVGLFNAQLRSGGDREFGMRATDAGAVIRYGPDVVVLHESRATLRALARKSLRIGRGLASQRRHAEGRLRALAPPPWYLALYTPPRHVPGWHRLSPEVPRHRRLLVRAVDYFGAQLPTAAGILVGSVRDD